MKPALRTALLLGAVVTTGATACAPGVYTCACPASDRKRPPCGGQRPATPGGLAAGVVAVLGEYGECW